MRNPMMKVGSILMLVLVTAATAGATHVVGEQASPCLNLRSAPGGAALACLAPGAQVEVLETDGQWGRARLATGEEGWLALAYLTPVARQEVAAAGFADPLIVREAAVSTPQVAPLGGVLYSQLDSPAGAGFTSQLFDPANATFDCRAADDFTVPPADIQWDVAGLQVLGAYFGGLGPTPNINVEFFGDGGGVPGASACSYPGLLAGVDYIDDGSGNLTVTLPSVCALPAGDYWVSVQADMDSTVGGQWLWVERSVQAGAGFAWENPPDGFGSGCVVWTPAGGCGASAPDLLFALNGVLVPVELQSISID